MFASLLERFGDFVIDKFSKGDKGVEGTAFDSSVGARHWHQAAFDS
jgi:hypothetical protein